MLSPCVDNRLHRNAANIVQPGSFHHDAHHPIGVVSQRQLVHRRKVFLIWLPVRRRAVLTFQLVRIRRAILTDQHQQPARPQQPHLARHRIAGMRQRE